MKVHKHKIVHLSNLLLVFCSVIVGAFTISSIFSGKHYQFNDCEMLVNGNIAITRYETFRNTRGSDINPGSDEIIMVNQDGEIVERLGEPEISIRAPHSILPLENDTYLIADCFNGEIDLIENKTTTWTYRIQDINWSKVDSSFNSETYFENLMQPDPVHVNDVDIRREGSTEYLLISPRNYNMIFEINFTAARGRTNVNESDITWWFGRPSNTSLLKMQHNPDYMEDGNIIVADSENGRILMVNYSSKEIYWDSSHYISLYWPRDADVCPDDDDTLLITDSLNHRVLEYDMEAQVINWEFSKDIIQPYHSDYLDDDKILIVGDISANVLIIDPNQGIIEWEYKNRNSNDLFRSMFLILLSLPLVSLVRTWGKGIKYTTKKKIFMVSSSIGMIIMCMVLAIFPSIITKLLVRITDMVSRNNFIPS
ncbi:hypothetical protein GF325_03810 [Candidatus Bathyarchaeota archaeon]|nr:hypothetical protein [Candidatus Bathyarchaeota archaeon]